MRVQSVLVTGAAGLIGGALCKNLDIAGANVTAIDVKHSVGRIDIRDKAKMKAAMRRVSGVVHLAAVEVGRSGSLADIAGLGFLVC